MKSYKGRVLYKEAFTTDKIFVFDEDCNSHDNVHSIFREDGARIYEKDLSMNPSVFSAKFIRAFYDVSKHDFVNEMYKRHGIIGIMEMFCESSGMVVNL